MGSNHRQALPEGISPRLFTRAQAAAYCQVSEEVFIAKCPVPPIKMGESVRLYRWDRQELDRWLDSLASGSPALAPNGQEWIDRLEGPDEGDRARPKAL
jgi:hypothetical protein